MLKSFKVVVRTPDGNKTIELTPESARELLEDLQRILGEAREVVREVPPPMPTYPQPPWCPGTGTPWDIPQYPIITCASECTDN